MPPLSCFSMPAVRGVAVFFLTLLAWAAPIPAQAELAVRSAILMDAGTGQILYEQNADEPIPPASLTKVLTMYMALEQVAAGRVSLDAPVRVSKNAARTGGSRMGLKPYEAVPLRELLMGMAVSSGNDASSAVAEFLGGSQQAFVEQMNARAASLGMTSSLFRNPHGLPAAGQVTTARDMMLLSARYLREYPQALRYHSTRFISHNGIVTYNKNPLLGNYEGADGLKTGWVNASGYNLISTAHRGNTRLLAVVLGAEDSKARAREIYRLMEAGFTARQGQGRTVAQVLPGLNPAGQTLTLHKTIHEAYATLAPGTLEKAAAKGKTVKKAAPRGTRKSMETARKNTNTAAHPARKKRAPSREETRQASLAQRKG